MKNKYPDLYPLIAHCMVKDQHRFYRTLTNLKRQQRAAEIKENSGKDEVNLKLSETESKWAALQDKIQRSVKQAEDRRNTVPDIQFPESLPVSQKAEEIADLIQTHQVVVIAGETGSGKTTQLPKICLKLGRGVKGLIGHTQPRRLAARAVSSRIADECGTELGDLIGFKVRFGDQVSNRSLVKLMTDGILLAEIQSDPYLRQYDTLIIDEAHERSLNIDFLLGYIKQLLPKRPDLKVIITSATIDVQRFSKHFNDAPVYEVSGRTFPVDVYYRPWQEMDAEGEDADLYTAVGQVVYEIEDHEKEVKSSPGDILIFLPGEREIRELSRKLKDFEFRHTEIVPLYARLSHTEQAKIFSSHAGRRIVLSTNVAETSLTVPGIRYVIDTGVARMSRYSYRTKIQRLPIEAISQSSANQRKGRCGRVEEGICFRMYSEEDFLDRAEFTEPEILRTNLASVILQMELLKLGALDDFPFIDKPDSRMVNDGYKLLFELKAVDEKRRLTSLGKQIAKMPIDPKLARMIIEANKENALKEILVIVSALSIQDPRDRPADKMQAADQKHAEYRHEQSDFLTWVTLWDAFEEQRQELSGNQLKKYCNKQFLAYMRMREWRDLHRQLHLLIKEFGFKENAEPAGYAQVHRSLLSGLLGGIARKEEKRIYMGGRNRLLNVFPGSSLYKKSSNWMMSAEIVETSKIFARMNAAIEPEWIEKQADHLVKRQWSEPHWEKKQGQVVASERVTLYGLDIVSNRKVSFSRIDPSLCREIFIRQALVEGNFTTKAPFWSKNKAAMAEVHDLEAKVRRRDILVDDETLFAFYDEHLPKDILSARHFENWWRKASPDELEAIQLTKEKLMARQDAEINAVNYPDAIETRGLRLPLQYHFEPGQKRDGVTLKVPVSALKQISPSQLEWVVPGLIREKCIQLIKRLPRQVRKHFVPVPDFVDKIMPSLHAEDETPLTESLANALLKKTGIRLSPDVWSTDALDDYLQFNIQVVDASGKILAESRDLNGLLEKFGDPKWSDVRAFDEAIPESESFVEWGNHEIQEEVRIKQAGVEMRLYPALQDGKDSVSLIHCNDAVMAQTIHVRGVARLYLLKLAPLLKNLEKQLTEFKRAALLYAPLGKADQLWDDLLMSVAHICFLESKPLPRNNADFNAGYDAFRANFIAICEEQTHCLFLIMENHNKIMKRLKGKMQLALAMPMADLKFQLSQLVKPGFLADTPIDWLKSFPRYLQACDIRLDKMGANLALENQVVPQLKQAWENYESESKALLKRGEENPELTLYRWMIEEWRVSLFAQQLGTKMTVSDKRLEKQWHKVKGLK